MLHIAFGIEGHNKNEFQFSKSQPKGGTNSDKMPCFVICRNATEKKESRWLERNEHNMIQETVFTSSSIYRS